MAGPPFLGAVLGDGPCSLGGVKPWTKGQVPNSDVHFCLATVPWGFRAHPYAGLLDHTPPFQGRRPAAFGVSELRAFMFVQPHGVLLTEDRFAWVSPAWSTDVTDTGPYGSVSDTLSYPPMMEPRIPSWRLE